MFTKPICLCRTEFSGLQQAEIEACSLSYALQTHSVLEKVMHLIPQNAVLAGDDIVPGILETKSGGMTNHMC